jgi:hypothetical protein
MQAQASALWRWSVKHRRELLVSTALALALMTLILAGPSQAPCRTSPSER